MSKRTIRVTEGGIRCERIVPETLWLCSFNRSFKRGIVNICKDSLVKQFGSGFIVISSHKTRPWSMHRRRKTIAIRCAPACQLFTGHLFTVTKYHARSVTLFYLVAKGRYLVLGKTYILFYSAMCIV